MRGGWVIGPRQTLMNQEWDEMCGAAYTPSAVTDDTKIHGVAVAEVVHPPIGGKGFHRGRGSGYPYAEDS